MKVFDFSRLVALTHALSVSPVTVMVEGKMINVADALYWAVSEIIKLQEQNLPKK